MCASSEAVVSAKLVGPFEAMANAGVEYMITAGSNPVLPKLVGEDSRRFCRHLDFGLGVNAGRTTPRLAKNQ